MAHSARDHVNSLLSNDQAKSTPTTSGPEPQPTGTLESIGLYDYPPNDPRSREHVTGRRQSRSTERNRQYRATRTRDEKKRRKSNDTRSRNLSQQRTRIREPSPQPEPEPQHCIGNSTEDESDSSDEESKSEESESDTSQRGRAQQRRTSRNIGSISPSPSLGSASHQRLQPTQTQSNSQYTYIYETLNHDDLVKFAQKEFGLDVQGCGTQAIIRQLRVAEAEQASATGASRRPPSIVVLPPVPLRVGGGWTQEVLGGLGSAAPLSSQKRSSTGLDAPTGSSKRQRTTIEESDDTATEPETDDEPAKQPQRGTHTLPLSRIPTASTMLQTQPELDSMPDPSQRATRRSSSDQYTYKGYRSHLPSEPVARDVDLPGMNDTTHTPSRFDPPHITPSQQVRQERARAVAAKAKEDLAKPGPSRRSRLFSSASQPPASRPQPRPPLGSKGNAVGHRMGASRRLDPASAARADTLAISQAMAQGRATSFIEDVTQQSERTARCAAPESRPLDGLLEDTEEELAKSEAFRKGKWPHTRRTRKPKPLQRDVSGIERQVLIMAKLHLFAYALVEGVYQTRATFLRWAAAVHEATWQMELPDHPYQKPSDEIFEIMVNNIATLRGKTKERLREFVARVSGFRQNLRDKNATQNNLSRFNELYPNSFHCRSADPREGDYEHPELGHCISLAIFHGASSVGVLYSDYFRDMPLPVVAFCLAMWQFCIEEWANGWRQNGDLGMGAMREKYEAQLAGLKELRDVAPRRMNRLQNEWRDYAAGYSGAVFVPDETDDAPACKSQMRPDTPEPDDAISAEEMDAILLETARQESLRERLDALAAEELEEMPTDEDEEYGASAPHTRPPSPLPVEFNEHGVMTARSKGKGRSA